MYLNFNTYNGITSNLEVISIGIENNSSEQVHLM